MFILTTLEDEVALHPSRFAQNRHIEEIRCMIEDKYVDRVISDVGLVVSLYDIVSVRDAYIFPGDLKDSQGDAACTVQFRVVVFRPKVNELLIGRIVNSTPMGLQVSLGFFQDVSIPANQLRSPSAFDERLGVWTWQYQANPDQAAVQYPYAADSIVCIRVTSIQFLDSTVDGARRALALRKDNKTAAPDLKIDGPREGDDSSHSKIPAEQTPMLVYRSMNAATGVISRELLKRLKNLKDVQVMSSTYSLSSLGELDESMFAALRREVIRRGSVKDNPSYDNRLPAESFPAGFRHPLELLLDTPNYMVLNKPPGMVVSLDSDLPDEVKKRAVIATATPGSSPELQSIISNTYGAYLPISSDKAFAHGVMHRLDKNTTGTLLIAKTYAAFYDIRFQFSANTIRKGYTCIVEGSLPVSDEWTAITSRLETKKVFIKGVMSQKSKVVESPRGDSAHTLFRCRKHLDLHSGPPASLVEIRLLTGRAHQIRVHMASVGHALLHDHMYGAQIDESDNKASMFLHAHSISFLDPTNMQGEEITVTADTP